MPATWKVKFKYQFCPVLSCPDHHDHYVHHDHHDFGDNDDHGNQEEVGGYVRKLKVVHKEVGGCLIRYNLQLACEGKLEIICIALNDESLITHSVTQYVRYVGKELLWQLKTAPI